MEEDDPEVVSWCLTVNCQISVQKGILMCSLTFVDCIVDSNFYISLIYHSFFLLQFKQAVYKQTMKLFAELEIKRKEREAKDMHER